MIRPRRPQLPFKQHRGLPSWSPIARPWTWTASALLASRITHLCMAFVERLAALVDDAPNDERPHVLRRSREVIEATQLIVAAVAREAFVVPPPSKERPNP